MVSIDKVKQGVASYLDNELIPQFQDSKLEKVLVGTAASLIISKAETIISSYKDHKLIKLLGIMDDNCNVDVNTLVSALKKNMPKDGVKIDIPIIGTMTFHRDDVDKLYEHITAQED